VGVEIIEKKGNFIHNITAVAVLSGKIWLLQVSFPCDAAQVQPK
jgi:hypothetical protein